MPAEPQRRRVLIEFAHPALHKSRVNRRLLDAIGGLEDVTINDLYEAYPDLDIDVAREQQLMAEHDFVVLQFPFYWYSTPAILKEWQDLVLEHCWAYGRHGKALHGKHLMCAISTGGSAESYGADGMNRFTVRQLLAPIEQTAHLCGMPYVPPFLVQGTHRLDTGTFDAHAGRYRRVIEAVRDGVIDLERAARLDHVSDQLDAILPDTQST